jgi:hypothetical protein
MKQLLLTFLLLPFVAASQTAETPQKCGPWLGINFSPDLAYRTTASKNDYIEDLSDKTEEPKFGYTAGANILLELNDCFSLESGIQYSKKGFRTEDASYVVELPEPSIPTHGWFEYNFTYLDLPVKLNYRPFSKNRFFISGGAILHLKLKNDVTRISYYADGHREEEMPEIFAKIDYKPIAAGIIAGFGTDMKVGKNSKLRVEPLFRHMITPIYGGSVKYYLWSAGLNMGFYWRLR